MLVICICVVSTFTKLLLGHYQTALRLSPAPYDWLQSTEADALSGPTLAVVVASQRGDDTRWLDAFKDWSKYIYVANDQSASLSVPKNKGHEGMVYLTQVSLLPYESRC